MPIWSVAVYPLEGLPVIVASSFVVPSEKTLSVLLRVGFWPRVLHTFGASPEVSLSARSITPAGADAASSKST